MYAKQLNHYETYDKHNIHHFVVVRFERIWLPFPTPQPRFDQRWLKVCFVKLSPPESELVNSHLANPVYERLVEYSWDPQSIFYQAQQTAKETASSSSIFLTLLFNSVLPTSHYIIRYTEFARTPQR